MSPSTRRDSWSLISRSWSGDLPVAPGMGQSSPFASAPMGHLSKQPNVMTLLASLTSRGVTNRGVRSVRFIPISERSQLTAGLTSVAGLTPALSACQPAGALELNISSERTLRKVFSTQTKRIVFVQTDGHLMAKNPSRGCDEDLGA